MTFVGSHFGMGLGNTIFMILFFIFGSILGIHFKIVSSTIIFIFIYIGSLFGMGNGTTLSVIIFFILILFLEKRLKKYFINTSFNNYF